MREAIDGTAVRRKAALILADDIGTGFDHSYGSSEFDLVRFRLGCGLPNGSVAPGKTWPGHRHFTSNINFSRF